MNRSGRGILWLVALMTVAYSAFGILRHWHFQSGYDLAIFDQAVWHYSRFETRTYGDLGAGPGAAFETILTQPLGVLGSLVSPPTKIRTFLMWVGPFLFLPLVSPLALPAIPLVLARFLSSSPQHWTTGFHYSAPLAPILAMSAIDGLARVLRRIQNAPKRERIASGAVALMLLLCAILPGKLPVWRLLSPAYYREAEDEATARRALTLIPTTASVVAQDSLTPHLSQRQSIYTLRPARARRSARGRTRAGSGSYRFLPSAARTATERYSTRAASWCSRRQSRTHSQAIA